jgi:hypothetical protein
LKIVATTVVAAGDLAEEEDLVVAQDLVASTLALEAR